MSRLSELLQPCQKQGTHFRERGKTVFIRPLSGEIVRLYVTDDKANPACTLRQIVGMSTEERICDCIFSYQQATGTQEVFCLVEVKGGNIRRAIDQLSNLYKRLEEVVDVTDFTQVRWKAYIYMGGDSPRDIVALKKRLQRLFPAGCDILRDPDLGKFLRKER